MFATGPRQTIPPDIDLVFAGHEVAFEHTRLQPRPLGWADGLRKKIDPGTCTTVPSISDPPDGRDEMLNTMLGIGDGAWSDVVDDFVVIRKSLMTSIHEKVAALPKGGIIAVVNHVRRLQTTRHWLALSPIFSLRKSSRISGLAP